MLITYVMFVVITSSISFYAQGGLTIGDIFEDFTIPTLSEDRNGNGVLDEGEDHNGNGELDLSQDISLYDQEGKIIVFDFFAYTCESCKGASEELQDFYEFYQEKGGIPLGFLLKFGV